MRKVSCGTEPEALFHKSVTQNDLHQLSDGSCRWLHRQVNHTWQGDLQPPLCKRRHIFSVMIFVPGDRELASGNLNHLPVGAQQLTGGGGGGGANISPPSSPELLQVY